MICWPAADKCRSSANNRVCSAVGFASTAVPLAVGCGAQSTPHAVVTPDGAMQADGAAGPTVPMPRVTPNGDGFAWMARGSEASTAGGSGAQDAAARDPSAQ